MVKWCWLTGRSRDSFTTKRHILCSGACCWEQTDIFHRKPTHIWSNFTAFNLNFIESPNGFIIMLWLLLPATMGLEFNVFFVPEILKAGSGFGTREPFIYYFPSMSTTVSCIASKPIHNAPQKGRPLFCWGTSASKLHHASQKTDFYLSCENLHLPRDRPSVVFAQRFSRVVTPKDRQFIVNRFL